jgi:hypothetical protein
MPEPIPGGRWGSGKEALREFLVEATVVHAAVAFVTDGGVGVLAGLLGELPQQISRFEIVARGHR